jgi:hypothetical protein
MGAGLELSGPRRSQLFWQWGVAMLRVFQPGPWDKVCDAHPALAEALADFEEAVRRAGRHDWREDMALSTARERLGEAIQDLAVGWLDR